MKTRFFSSLGAALLAGACFSAPILTWAPLANTTLVDGNAAGTVFVGQTATQWFSWTPGNAINTFGSVITSAGSMLIRTNAAGDKFLLDNIDPALLNGTGQTCVVLSTYDPVAGTFSNIGPIGTGISGRANSGCYDFTADGTSGVSMVWETAGRTVPYHVNLTTNTLTPLPKLDATKSARASAISDNGNVIGGWEQTNNRAAAIWEKDANGNWFQSLSPATGLGEVNAISPDGNIRAGWRGANIVLWNASNAETNLGQPFAGLPNAINVVTNAGGLAGSAGSVLTGGIRAMLRSSGTAPFINLRDNLIARGITLPTNQVMTVNTWMSADGDTVAGWGNGPQGTRQGYVVNKVIPRISGTINLNDLSVSPAGKTATITIQDASGANTLWTGTASLDASGSFEAKIGWVLPSIGASDVTVKVSHWLAKKFDNVVIAGYDPAAVSGALLNGDVNDDNEVGAADFSALAAAYDAVVGDPNYSIMADLNEDGEVGAADFSILAANYDQVGD